MPIKIPDNLPGRAQLEKERVFIIPEGRALRQDVRPMQVLIMNLMPDKVSTETQLLRVLGATPLQVEITLMHPGSHTSKNTATDHLGAFYVTHDQIKDRNFDALIVTGAPIEHLPYEEVNYWPELQKVFEWAQTHVYSSLFICWGAQAALYHYHGVNKHALPAKQFGVFPHKVLKPFDPLMNGFDDGCHVPVSRHTEVRLEDVEKISALEVMLESDKTGICLVHEPEARRLFMFNHLEYDAETLKREYDRDAASGMNTALPFNYFPDDNPALPPRITWRAHRNLFFSNWINMVYQGTPFNIKDLKECPKGWRWG